VAVHGPVQEEVAASLQQHVLRRGGDAHDHQSQPRPAERTHATRQQRRRERERGNEPLRRIGQSKGSPTDSSCPR
jgi:hypothetical protein